MSRKYDIETLPDLGMISMKQIAKMLPHTKIKVCCEVCGKRYVATARKNSAVGVGRTIIDAESSGVFGFGTKYVYKPHKVWEGRCPNCQHTQTLFYEEIR